MEGRDQTELKASGYRARLLSALVAGALLGAVASVVVGFLLRWTGRREAEAFRSFLVAGGWLWIPLWGAALAALRGLPWAGSTKARLGTVALAALLALLPIALRPEYRELERTEQPVTIRAKSRAILKWSFRTPETVALIVPFSRDPDPQVREQAILAMGVNLVVNDLQHPSATRPSRYERIPLRDSLRLGLLEALKKDSAPSVRAEAARALWNAPLAFGRHPAAAETLAALLDRSETPADEARIAWLALDAAAGAYHPALEAAAIRFASSTSDPELVRAARLATSRWQSRPDSGKNNER